MIKADHRKPDMPEARHPTIPAPRGDAPFAGWGPRLGVC
jgi:hypothetical protein